MRSVFQIILLVVIAMVVGSGCHISSQEVNEMMKIYYVPIGAETLVPITSGDIQKKGHYCEMRTAKDIDTIHKVLKGAAKPSSQKFSDRAVRVKLIEASAAGDQLLAIIENEGEVRFADGSEGTISPRGMVTIKKIIESQCR